MRFIAQLRSSYQDFDRHRASRGPSATAEPLVAVTGLALALMITALLTWNIWNNLILCANIRVTLYICAAYALIS